jgi:enoyl-CoA hydratase/carnithine racemase
MNDTTSQAVNLTGDVPRPRLEAYAEKYRHVFAFERTHGVLEARLHHDGGVAGASGWFNVWSQAWWEIGNDPDNEVIILTATGEQWIEYPFPRTGEITEELRAAITGLCTGENAYRLYLDALKNTENLIFGLNVPTIGVIQGPAFVHFETALLCDITLCADDVVFKDPHADFGLAPGDGLGLAFQHLMNPKQQAYYLYTSESMDAGTALRLGILNEVLPRADLLPRARAIAARILRMPKLARLMTKQIIRRQLQQRHVQDAGFHLAHELLGFMTNVREGTAHTPEHVRASLDEFDADRAAVRRR